MAENKKQPGFYERSGEQDNKATDKQSKTKEARGKDNCCNKCSKFEKKTIDACKCSSKYRESRKINQI